MELLRHRWQIWGRLNSRSRRGDGAIYTIEGRAWRSRAIKEPIENAATKESFGISDKKKNWENKVERYVARFAERANVLTAHID